ncbi:MAG: hypothetical protein J0H17_20070 [Rhizobiales bacterium]|nr:hypothetical protein [Hyphomicrobiales bacterium]
MTWLTPRIMDAFWDLHEAGYAHSIEVWDLKPRLVGGIFGIAIGNVFFANRNSQQPTTPRRLHPPFSTVIWQVGASCCTCEMDDLSPRALASPPSIEAPFRACCKTMRGSRAESGRGI